MEGFGEFRTTQFRDGDSVRLWIDRADSRVLVSDLIVTAAKSGETLFTRVDGDVLEIAGENRTVRYLLGERRHDALCYEADRLD